MSFVYLASPYTPHGGESMQERTDAACAAAAKLMQQGHSVFSPIAHSHYVAAHLPDELRTSHDFWMRQDLAILRHADKLIVLCLPGWGESKGIATEITAAIAARIPVEYMDA
jgi:Domain of unknown function (DUF1937)